MTFPVNFAITYRQGRGWVTSATVFDPPQKAQHPRFDFACSRACLDRVQRRALSPARRLRAAFPRGDFDVVRTSRGWKVAVYEWGDVTRFLNSHVMPTVGKAVEDALRMGRRSV